MIKKYFNFKFIFANIFVPLAALTLYCFGFAYLSSQFLPVGVSYFFAQKFGNYLLFALLGTVILLLAARVVNKDETWKLPPSKDKVIFSDLILLLLPLSPVIQYIFSNQEHLSGLDVLFLLAFFLVFSGIFTLIIPSLLGRVGSFRLLRAVGLAFAFTITNMAILTRAYAWFEIGSFRKVAPVFLAVFIVTLLLGNLKNKWFLYLPILGFFLSNCIIQVSTIGLEFLKPPAPLVSKLPPAVKDKQPKITPNVYLLAYDSYVPNETMLAYGIDNSEQQNYLSELGFQIYPHTYSIGGNTVASMSLVLNASNSFEGYRKTAVSGDGRVIHLFKDLGKKTYGIFPTDYMFQDLTPKYDYYYPRYDTPPSIHLLSAIMLGEFRFDLGFTRQPYEEFLEEKAAMLNQASANQSFVYTHSEFPSHTQISGTCLPDETERYQKKLEIGNLEMKTDIQNIMNNDPSGIIIILGDHGPHLTKNCFTLTGVYDISEVTRLDIQDRYGTFLAIKWPTSDFIQYDDITTIQDIFPAVFAYMYKDPTILESKINPVIPTTKNEISGASVNNGIISGGIDDGEPLFLSSE